MRGSDHDGDAERVEGCFDRVGDLSGEALLHLEALGQRLDGARDLGEAHDRDLPVLALSRDVADPGRADDRREVMLARRLHADVADDDHLVVLADVAEGARQDLGRILGVAAGPLEPRLHCARGRVPEPFAVGVFADVAEQYSDRFFGIHRSPITLCVCTVMRHRGCAIVHSAAARRTSPTSSERPTSSACASALTQRCVKPSAIAS